MEKDRGQVSVVDSCCSIKATWEHLLPFLVPKGSQGNTETRNVPTMLSSSSRVGQPQTASSFLFTVKGTLVLADTCSLVSCHWGVL